MIVFKILQRHRTLAYVVHVITLILFLSACKKSSYTISKSSDNEIECDDNSCYGKYTGPEFINGSDIAHQFSNKMSARVGDMLKELYDRKKYSVVDYSSIIMTTNGMGTGKVEYVLEIPFRQVESKCAAYTSFDHVGGWNHKPELGKRKEQLRSALMPGEALSISEKKTTIEGLQEYLSLIHI